MGRSPWLVLAFALLACLLCARADAYAQGSKDWVTWGEPGQPGHYQWRLDRGQGALAELRVGQGAAGAWESLFLPNPEEALLRIQGLQVGPVNESADAWLTGIDGDWEVESVADTAGLLRLTLRGPGGQRLVKELEAQAGCWELKLRLTYHDPRPSAPELRCWLFPAGRVPYGPKDPFRADPYAVGAWDTEGSTQMERKACIDGDSELSGPLGHGDRACFAGVHNKYFAALLRPSSPAAERAWQASHWLRLGPPEALEVGDLEGPGAYRTVLSRVELRLQPGQVTEFTLFAGPRDPEMLAAASGDYHQLARAERSFLAFLVPVLQSLLSMLHGLVGSWGGAIILLTLCLRGLLFPLNLRSQVLSLKYQAKLESLEPLLEELEQKFGDRPSTLSAQRAMLLKREGAFPPLSGCLSLLVQGPVIFGVFALLLNSFSLYREPFGWIADLSQPDHFRSLSSSLWIPYHGQVSSLHLLPLLLVGAWFVQQVDLLKAARERSHRRMQVLMIPLIILFGYLLYQAPAGLMVYMIASSVLGTLEAMVVRRVWRA